MPLDPATFPVDYPSMFKKFAGEGRKDFINDGKAFQFGAALVN